MSEREKERQPLRDWLAMAPNLATIAHSESAQESNRLPKDTHSLSPAALSQCDFRGMAMASQKKRKRATKYNKRREEEIIRVNASAKKKIS